MAGGAARARVDLWHSLFRIGVGAFWMYFAAQKWQGVGWMRSLIEQSARTNPVPGLREVLAQVVAPNWELFAIAQGAAETAVAVLLILGVATRPAAVLGTLLALNLSLTVAFLSADVGTRWLYYLAVLVNLEVAVDGAGSLALLRRMRSVPAWLAS